MEYIKREISEKIENIIIYNDAPMAWGTYFQDSGSSSFDGIVELHDQVIYYLIIVLFSVGYTLFKVVRLFNQGRKKIIHKLHNHGTSVELIWTITPALILVAIILPSFKLLYLQEDVFDPAMTVKVTGYQWYWTYEYTDFTNQDGEFMSFDSYMILDDELELGQLRKLDVDTPLTLPVDTHIRFVVTGNDVIHDFAVPSLGIKVDANPGRLNQSSIFIRRESTYYGQCSELCGVNHSSMPIVINAISVEKFLSFLDDNY